MNVIKKLIVILLLIVCGNSMTYGVTFDQWASGFGLTGNETTIHCIGAGVTDLTGLANNYPNLTVLVMWGNSLGSIQSGDFDGLDNLTEMYLNENQITSIESGDFTGLSSLKYLYLNDNLITSIDSGDFTGLSSLKYLYLNDNQITSIESGDFDGLVNLERLDLGGNQITSIESGDFAGLGNLTFLSISGNLLTSIDSGDFVGLGNMNRLSLSGNQITGIESGDFTGLLNLTCLILSGNQISSLESGDFDGPASLAQLYLKDNQITSIESGDFTGLSSLEYLYLNDNSITSIDSGDFDGLSSLARLYLGGNQVATMDFSNSDLSLLRSFDIIGNPLTSVQLTDAALSQASFNALMNGGALLKGAAKESPGWCYGIAEIPGVLDLNMSGVDFSGISHISRMHTMDALEELLLIDATNITGSDVCELTVELASLNLLNVIGLWDTFDAGSQSTLNAWDAIPGNVLITIPSETDPPTPNPATFAVAPAADSGSAISMTATTGSDVTGPIEYRFTETSGNPGGSDSGWQSSTSYTDSDLDPLTQYTYTVTMRDGLGNTGAASDPASATTHAQTEWNDLANADITVAGTVSGSYVDTQVSDNGYQSITERESGGKPANRYSYLEHKWTIDVTGSDLVTFYVEAYQSASSDGDNFTFAYSTNDSSYTDMLTVTKIADDDSYQSYSMPASLSGTVYIRVTDTDQTSGNRNLDTISIDHMFIRSTAPGPPDVDPPTPDPMTWASPPASTGPSSIIMTATAASDPSGVEYYFTCTAGGGNDSGWQDSTTYEDTGLSPSTQYTYTVTASDKSVNQNETAASSEASATTDAPGADIYVNDIAMGWRKQGRKYFGQATVWIVESGSGTNIEGATVYGQWSGDVSGPDQGVTLADGTVMIESPGKKNGGTYTFTVTDVVKSGQTYNASLNVETFDTIVAP